MRQVYLDVLEKISIPNKLFRKENSVASFPCPVFASVSIKPDLKLNIKLGKQFVRVQHVILT